METKTFYNEVLTDHNMHPYHKHDIDNADLELEGVNPSCGDDIILKLKFDDAKKTIVDGAFTGDGCAISQASADIMLELIIGKPIDEAVHLSELFLKMIKDEATEEEIDELDEAGALRDISHMPARVNSLQFTVNSNSNDNVQNNRLSGSNGNPAVSSHP